jgi:MFS transporter, SP family, general alpha glucoside:H+ symporter
LVRKGREADAKTSLLKLTKANSGVQYDIDAQVAMIKATNELERALAASTTYLQCFRGIDARRTEIACVVWVTQAFCGASLMGYSVQFYQQAGLTDEGSFNLNLGQYAMGAVGTIASWFLMPHVGRRNIYIYGLLAMFIILMIVGFAGIPERTSGGKNSSASWAIGSMLLIYTFV